MTFDEVLAERIEAFGQAWAEALRVARGLDDRTITVEWRDPAAMNGKSRVRAVQEMRRSGAAGPHRARPIDPEPCVCGTGFTCLASEHPEAGEEDRDAPGGSDAR